MAFCVWTGTALVADAAGGGGAAGCSGVRARTLTPAPGTALEVIVVAVCTGRAGRTVEAGGRAVDGVRIEGGTVAGFTS